MKKTSVKIKIIVIILIFLSISLLLTLNFFKPKLSLPQKAKAIQTITCEHKLNGIKDEYDYYDIKKIKTQNDKLVESQSAVRIECYNQTTYRNFQKSTEDFVPQLDDENKFITYDTSQKEDLTNVKLTVEAYLLALEEAGFVCQSH